MALVSHQHGFIYLKTFKTGSTSTEMALQPLCTPPGTKVRQYGPAIVSEQGIVGARGKHVGADETGWHNHMSAMRVAWKLGPRRWMRYLKVASLRNPYDKAVSWYWFWSERQGRAGAGSVEDFRAFIGEQDAAGHFRSRRDTDWHVTHILGRPIIDQYIRLEHLQTDLTLLAARLGITGLSLDVPRVKTRTRKKDPRPVPEYFDTPTADILRRNWDWIFEAGGYSLDPADAGRASGGIEQVDTAPRVTPEGQPSARAGGSGVEHVQTRGVG